MDGTLGSQTARMLDGSGVEITSGDELAEIVRRGAEAGWPVAVHAIGDRANREALDAFERTEEHWQPARPAAAHRARAVPRARGHPPFRRARRRRVRPVQPRHRPTATSPSASGQTQLDGTYAFRSLVESGAVVANGSDAPIEELDPWAGVCAGVLRTLDERPAWRADQAVTLEQALAATITAPAWLVR